MINIYAGSVGTEGVTPRRVQIKTTDALSTILTAGWLTLERIAPNVIYPTDIIDMIYLFNPAAGSGIYGEFLPTISSKGSITLTQYVSSGNVTSAAVGSAVNQIAFFNDGTGEVINNSAGTVDANANMTLSSLNTTTGFTGGLLTPALIVKGLSSGQVGALTPARGWLVRQTTNVMPAGPDRLIYWGGTAPLTQYTIAFLSDLAAYVAGPVSSVDGNLAVFSGVTGEIIKDSGYAPTDATKTKVVMANGAVVIGRMACFTDTVGTVDDNAATAVNGGNVQAGLSGTAGTLASFPATAARGSLKVVGVANTGNTDTTISNAAMAQASVVTIPDPGTATANFLVTPTVLTNNNLVKASGTAGKVADVGAAISAQTTAVYGGGGTSNAFSAVGLTSSSVVAATIRAQTGTASIIKAVPSADTLTVTFSADPGAGTQVSWVALSTAI